MSAFYKMEPLKWDRGTDDLTLEQEAAYLRIVNAINAADQAIRENYRMLAGMWRCNERRATRLLRELVEAGKVTVDDGWISNRKAMDDVSTRRQLSVERSSNGRRGGIESGKSRAKSLKDNETDEAIACSRIEENRREEKRRETETIVSVARKRAKPKTRIPEDADISTKQRAMAVDHGLSDAEAEAQFAKFRDRALAHGQAYADWDAAWRNWLTSPFFAPATGKVTPFPTSANSRIDTAAVIRETIKGMK